MLVVEVGVIVTTAPDEALNPVAGLQLYVKPPLAVKVVVVFAQIFNVCVSAPFICVIGKGLTVIALLNVCLLPQTPLTTHE